MMMKQLTPNARVADIGSGGGLPIIPCLIARPDVQAILIESSKKKAVFLREALCLIGATNRAEVIAERFESVSCPDVDYVSCRAVERFENLITDIVKWSSPLAKFIFFAGKGLEEPMTNADLEFTATLIPHSEKRFLFVARRK